MVQANVVLGSEDLKKTSFKDKIKSIMSGVSGAFVFPIATMAILAFFLSVGGFLESFKTESASSARIFAGVVGSFLKQFSFPLLKALPILFCVAFSASFCKNDVVYVWGSLISYLVFLAVQNTFIFQTGQTYTVLFSGWGRDSSNMGYMIENILGFKSLNTSIFGAFLIGGVITPYIQRKWGNVNLRGPFAFFSGKRFVPLVSSVLGGALALYALLLWPWIGKAFSIAGNFIAKTPFGIDSFIFGVLEKSLIPFGLHHAFYAPLWYSSLGGDALEILKDSSSDFDTTSAAGTILSSLKSGSELGSKAMWMGDSFLGMSAISLPSDTLKSTNGQSIMDFFASKGLNIGRFTQGKYPIMQFCLPSAALAMILSAPKAKRKEALKKLIPGIASSFFMGITEPIEFSFLFIAPKLFYGFHAVFCGISFALMNALGAHIPSIFSGGFIEAILLGVIPFAKGTHFYMYLFVGLILAPIYFTVFSFAIEILNLSTPGREPIDETLDTDNSLETSKVPSNIRKIALSLGGWDNVSKYSNCASRLRYDIVDKSKVNEAGLKSAGIIAVKWVGDNHVQLIVGPKAEFINNELLKWKGESL